MIDIEKYLGKKFSCTCGHKHQLNIKELIIGVDVLKKVPALVKELSQEKLIYLICDQNTYQAAAKKLSDYLKKEFQVKLIILEDEHVVPDPDSIFKILEKITGEGYLIACGSGTINDLTRFISYKLGRPYLVVATAPSMDGYASSVAPLTVDGVKKTYIAQAPEAIVADLLILEKAPWDMIQAGFGDLLGKVTALLDWNLARILLDEYYCPFAVQLVQEQLDKIMDLGHKLKERDRDSIEALIKGLINSGLAMLMVDNSRPASGAEHHFSHFLEMYGLLYDEEIPLHGIQVALGTYFSAYFYLNLIKIDFSTLKIKEEDKEKRINRIKEVYQERAHVVLANLEERLKDQISLVPLKDKEVEIKEMIQASAEQLEKTRDYLNTIGILENNKVKNIPKDWLVKALHSSFEIRTRFTIFTLLNQLGLLEEQELRQLLDSIDLK